MYNNLLEEAVKLNQVPKLLLFIEMAIEYHCNKLWGEMGNGEMYLELKKNYHELISLGFDLSKNCDFKSFSSELACDVLQKRVK